MGSVLYGGGDYSVLKLKTTTQRLDDVLVFVDGKVVRDFVKIDTTIEGLLQLSFTKHSQSRCVVLLRFANGIIVLGFKGIFYYKNFHRQTLKMTATDERQRKRLGCEELTRCIEGRLEHLWASLGLKRPSTKVEWLLQSYVVNRAGIKEIKALLYDSGKQHIALQNIDRLEERGFHLIHFAARAGRLDVIKWLVQELNVDVCDRRELSEYRKIKRKNVLGRLYSRS